MNNLSLSNRAKNAVQSSQKRIAILRRMESNLRSFENEGGEERTRGQKDEETRDKETRDERDKNARKLLGIFRKIKARQRCILMILNKINSADR